jgi:hypothetical protein
MIHSDVKNIQVDVKRFCTISPQYASETFIDYLRVGVFRYPSLHTKRYFEVMSSYLRKRFALCGIFVQAIYFRREVL